MLKLLLVFSSLALISQQDPIDSLETYLSRKDIIVQQRVDAMNVLAREYAYISSYEAQSLSEKSLELSRKEGYKKGEAYAMRNLATFYLTREYFYTGMEFLEKALILFEELDDSIGKANCYISLANNYRRQNLHLLAIEYDFKAMEIFEKNDILSRSLVCYHNAALSFILSAQIDQSEKYIQKALNISSKEQQKSFISACVRVLGLISLAKNEVLDAENHFLEVIQISEELEEKSQKEAHLDALLYLSDILSQRKEFDEAIAYLKEARVLSRKYDYPKMLNSSYQKLVKVYIASGNNVLALKAMEDLLFEQDSLNQKWNQDKGVLLESARNMIRVRDENATLSYEKIMAENKLGYQSRVLIIFIVSFIFIFLLLLVLVRGYRRLNRLNKDLDIQKSIIEEKSEKLEEINQSKNKFFSIVSHDLKSPLNSLSGFINIFKSYHDQLSKEEVDKLVMDIEKSLNNSISLADNLIIWAKSQMEVIDYTPEIFELNTVVKEITDLYRSAIDEKNLQLHLNISEKVEVNANKPSVEFILRNLINNAVKFTKENDAIQITANVAFSTVQISISNDSDGIRKDILEQLFKLGSNKSTQGTKGEKGTGLGLVIAQEFAKKNNTSLEVKYTSENQVVFSFNLPIA